MLRTNPSILSYFGDIYGRENRSEHIMLKTFAPGSLLLRQDSRPAKVFIIREGITKCYFSEDNGKDFIFEFLGEGEIVGEIEVIRNAGCLCSIEALTEVTAYAVDVPFFKNLQEKDPAVNRLLLAELAERLFNTCIRASSQQLYTVEHGLKKMLALQEKQQARIPKEDMAAYLGVTLRTLNRALKGLKEQ